MGSEFILEIIGYKSPFREARSANSSETLVFNHNGYSLETFVCSPRYHSELFDSLFLVSYSNGLIESFFYLSTSF